MPSKIPWSRLITVIIAMAILGALATLGYIIVKPNREGKFTEFYILNSSGEATNYPKQLRVGEIANVIVGVVNHEGKECSYRIDLMVGSSTILEVGSITLIDGKQWESELSFALDTPGENREVDFSLYQVDRSKKLLEQLHLLIDVIE